MSTSAIVTMVIGMVALWGGLAVSVALAVRSHRARHDGAHARPDDQETR